VIVLFYLPSNTRTDIRLGSRITLIFKNLVVSIANKALIKAKPFTPVLISVEVLILYLLRDIVYRIVKYFLPIKRLRLIFSILIPYPRVESFPKARLFPARARY